MSTVKKAMAFALIGAMMVQDAGPMYIPKILSSGREPYKRNTKREGPKVGRNQLCTCGSGKKNKHCCKID